MDSGSGGSVEVVYSQSERVGLPNYSHVDLLVSAKGSVGVGEEGAGFDHLHAIVNSFVYDRIERVVKALSLNYVVNPDERERVDGGNLHPTPAQLFKSPIESVFSMTEQIGQPGYSHIRLMASAKALWNAANLREGFDYLSATVSAQMGQKRALVLANPRPWLSQS